MSAYYANVAPLAGRYRLNPRPKWVKFGGGARSARTAAYPSMGIDGDQPLPRTKIRGSDALSWTRSLGFSCSVELLAMWETEALLLDLLQHCAMLPEFARDASYAERDELLLKKPLDVLNGALVEHDYLVGNSLTVADLNVASILLWGTMARLNLSNHPGVGRWFDTCLARPAYGRVRERASRK